ncbi:hypothetical protein GPL17_20305 [Bradyrhizobium yuanmingense]|uniref:hypothetical protein n=1 Tax=Bradyrhizobium yuanmingense TaxID=108015 RepID=UPI0012F88806|nr:hypothetical protein [Bradyrhizobium yuanmingense]MVT52822.1 hypothetical protein [Bradyrhizobium yuanmingense]
MPFSRRTIVIALLLSAASPTCAQTQDRATLVREALASPYGKALTAELGKSLRASADPACLTDKGLAADQLEPRGRDIVIRWGTHMLEGASAFIDRQISDNPFAGAAELESLKSNPDVKRYLAMEEPIRQAKILDLIFEHFDRYNLIARVKLGGVYPLQTGNEALLRLNPTDATEERLETFASKSRSKALKRFLQLSDQEAIAQSAAIKKASSPPPFPHTFFKGVETDLAELCIRSGK